MAMTHLDQFPEGGFDLGAFAPRVGPFPMAEFLRAWWQEFQPDARVVIISSGSGALPLMESAGVIQFLGDSDLTDYHSPLGQDVQGPVDILVTMIDRTTSLDLDSLPGEAATAIAESLSSTGLRPKTSEQTVARVLQLPSSIDDYHLLIGKKERHELRRKRRRYEEQVGPATLSTNIGTGFGFDEFVRLHRLAPGDKGTFMTGERHRFFSRLAGQDGWRVDYLENDGAATACLFGWTDGSDYYLYNSSFDPAFHSASPGQVLLAAMIEHAITEGWGVFDFLKGDESYKARLGAVPRQLFRVEASR
ncbi:MAG TPA: GNAT family N-acetyltransferase [Acidimicrobiia bacterium]|nr:GNAT family N-acetyltransferase [Acidimicrobiia bacterium]